MGASLVLLLVLPMAACAPDDPDRPQTETSAVITNRNLDLLFMIDNSSSMRLSQANLEANFPTFMNVLKGLPGGLPNIHVAVISSDMGAGNGDIASCDATGGNNGVFQYTARGTCTASPLTGGATYLSNVGGVVNYTGDISAAFTCIAALGEHGVWIRAPVRVGPARSRRRRPECARGEPGVPAARRAAGHRDGHQRGRLFGASRQGALRCQHESDAVVGAGTALQLPLQRVRARLQRRAAPRLAPGGDVTAVVPLQNCVASECAGALTPVAEFVARIKALKAAPDSEVFLGAIAGPTTPYTVQWKAPSTSDTGPWPLVAHSCTAADTSFADPGVRVAQAVSAFGANGVATSICETNFGPGLQAIATRIGTLLTAGGGSGASGGTIPTCTGTGGGGGTTGVGGSNVVDAGPGSGGAGGTTGAGATTGADASADARGPKTGGGWCQVGGVGGAGANASGVGFAIMALLGAWRRRGHRAAGESRPR